MNRRPVWPHPLYPPAPHYEFMFHCLRNQMNYLSPSGATISRTGLTRSIRAPPLDCFSVSLFLRTGRTNNRTRRARTRGPTPRTKCRSLVKATSFLSSLAPLPAQLPAGRAALDRFARRPRPSFAPESTARTRKNLIPTGKASYQMSLLTAANTPPLSSPPFSSARSPRVRQIFSVRDGIGRRCGGLYSISKIHRRPRAARSRNTNPCERASLVSTPGERPRTTLAAATQSERRSLRATQRWILNELAAARFGRGTHK